ncbi:MAG: hypothetical protein GTO22_05210 [Gemmatimonadales bacterium]|nr:hypothetical protein [Gemmatimonadales bacterium]
MMEQQTVPELTASGQPPFNWEGCDLSGKNLQGKDLTNANLKNTNLTGTIFKGVTSMEAADLSGATMGDGTDFSGCDLSNTIFGPNPNFGSNPDHPTKFLAATIPYQTLGTSWNYLDLTDATIPGLPQDLSRLEVRESCLTGIDLSGKTLKNAHFCHAILQNADFSDGILNHIVFGGQTDLTGATFRNARLPYSVFDKATLTRTDFTEAEMYHTSFLQTRMDGAKFDNTNVTTCSFSEPPRFSSDPSNLTSFKGATLNYSTIRKRWFCLDLTDATLVGLNPRVDLTYLDARYATISGMDLRNYTLNKSNFTGATLNGTQFNGAKMEYAQLRGVQGTQTSFHRATLLHANFSPDGHKRTSLRGAVFNEATLNHADFSEADLSPVDLRDETTASQFVSAKMSDMDLSEADLTGAQLTGGVLLHNTNLSNSTLKNADLSGAHLGMLSELFRVAKASNDYPLLLRALQGSNAADVCSIFANYQHRIAAGKTTVKTTVAERSWRVSDKSTQTTYMVLNWTASDGATFLIIAAPTHAATLTGAYMPHAKLTNANLYGVKASHLQLYDNANLEGAILDEINLSEANLGSISLKGAMLYGATMSDACLINAQLSAAVFDGRVTLEYADLQGADFTDTQLNNVNLSNASVSIRLGAAEAGVYLFGVGARERRHQDALDEMNAAASGQIDLTPDQPNDLQKYVRDLNNGDLHALRRVFERNGVTFSQDVTITTIDRDAVWQIGPAEGKGGQYTVWKGHDDLGEYALFARPSLPILRRVFHDKRQIGLRRQATVSWDEKLPGWRIDNDSMNEDNPQLGYMTYVVLQEQDASLSFYGTSLRIERLGDDDRKEIRIVTYDPTILCKTGGDKQQECNEDGTGSFFGPDTICPNTHKFSTNRGNNRPWTHMLRAPQLPKPPECVPSPFKPCPPPRKRAAK